MSQFSSAISESIKFRNSQGVEARGTILKISRNQIIFETYNPYAIVQLSEVLEDIEILRSGKNFSIGKAVVSGLINTGLILVISATLVDSFARDSEVVDFTNIDEIFGKFIFDWQQSDEKIPDGFRLSVNKMNSFLTETSRWVENTNINNNKTKNLNFENEIVDKMAISFLPKLSELLGNFENEAAKIENFPDKISKEICKLYSQRELHPLMMQSPFFNRCLCKPLGYAGDYEMVNMMLRDPHEGEVIYSKLINIFLLGRGPAEAHRNRIDILFEKIKETALKAYKEGRKAKIFNFACGPAIEVQRFIELEELSENCEFNLLDFSKPTLDYTENAIEKSKQKSGRKVEVKYIHKSAHEALKEATKINLSKSDENNNFDLVYCAGLFDYLSDKVCSKLLELFFFQLKPGGNLLATNVHINQPTKALMEYLMEWYLTYRDEKGFLKLINAKNKKVYADKTGWNIFLDVYKS